MSIDWFPIVLQSRSLLRPLLSLALGLTLSASAIPSRAALSDWWPFGRKDAQEPIPDPVEYTPLLAVGDTPGSIEKALRNESVLIDRKGTPASGLGGLIARARQDRERLAAVLYENAFYAGEIAITIDGKPLETIGPFDPIMTRPLPVDIKVTAGSVFTFGKIDSKPLPDDLTLKKLGLITGNSAKSGVVVGAEVKIADAWREQGHPLVVVHPRTVVADHATHTLDVTLDVDAGPRANFGRVAVTGKTTLSSEFVVGRAGLDGQLYSSKKTKSATTRLRDLGVFDSVRVAPGDQLDPDGTIPITIAVTDRKPHVLGGSVFYSNTEGSGIEGFWRHRNLFGGAEQLEVKAGVSRVGAANGFDPDYRVGSTLKKPGILGPLTDGLLRVEGYRQTTDAYRVTALEQEAGLSRIFSDTLTGSIGLELARSRTVAAKTTEDHLLATLRSKLDWDTRDIPFDPTQGFRTQYLVAPAHDFRNKANFATVGADASIYRSVGADDRLVFAARVAVTSLITKNVLDVAPDKRIYAGGAGSIRGYGYKNIAPRNAAGDIVGGRSSLIVSGELRYRLNAQFGLVGFVDAGNVNEGVAPNFRGQKVGIGAGIRYLTPIGPLRFDVGVPLQPENGDPRVAVYVGLGQAF
ncbi:MAG: autotransporter assembly complex family protein [Casimicrobiaceae bacterium]